MALIKKLTAVENSAVILTARILDPDTDTARVPADFTAGHLRVYDVTDRTAPALVNGPSGEDLTIADVILPSLDTTSKLNTDTAGFNFRYDLAGDLIPEGGRTYQVEVKLTPQAAEGDPFYLLWEIKTTPVYSE